VEIALEFGLTADPPPGNLDIKPLKGAKPWLRMRVGDWRIIFRPFSRYELSVMGEQSPDAKGFLVARIINRRDLEGAMRTLEL
jgi:hypothetical protein